MMFQGQTEKTQDDGQTEGWTDETKTGRSSVQTQQADERMKRDSGRENGENSDKDESITSL